MNRRYEKCRECGLDWNVSINLILPPGGYICPHCWRKQQNEAIRNAIKKRSNK